MIGSDERNPPLSSIPPLKSFSLIAAQLSGDAVRQIGVFITLVVVSAGVCAQAFPEPRVIRLNERVHVLLGPLQHANPQNQGYMVNSTLIIGDKGAILVDPGGTAEVGRHIASAVRRITDKPVTHVVNTHYHGDHYLGNQAFDGARIISSEVCRKMVLETGQEWLRLMERLIGRALPETRPLASRHRLPRGSEGRNAYSRRSVDVLGAPWLPYRG